MSNASDCSSYSFTPEFKNYIDDQNGSLFYIKVQAIDQNYNGKISNAQAQNDNPFQNEFKRMSLRQREKGILSKITGKKKSSIYEYKFKVIERQRFEHADGEMKEIKIASKTGKAKKLNGKKHDYKSLFEVMFNASIIYETSKRFVFDKIDSSSIFYKDFSVGDYIKTIDGEILTVENISTVLKKIENSKFFKIVVQESFRDGYATQEEIKITKIQDIVRNREKLFQLELFESHELIYSLNIIVKNEQVTEGAEGDDFTSLFSFPPMQNNFLYKLKGSFLTLASIMKTSFKIYPVITSVKVHDTVFYVTYTIRKSDNEFIFLGFNSKYASLSDANCHRNNFIKYLDYIYPNFVRSNDFMQLTTLCEIVKTQLMKNSSEIINFEQLFSCSKYIPLPKEIVLRINDALSELEAMDYRNWNESLIELFGKFNIIGSCLYYKSFLLCSHFNESELKSIEIFLHKTCLKFLYETCIMNEAAIWQRIYPKDYQSFNMENDSSKNKIFLLIAARGNLMMCALLEENSYNIIPDIETQSSNYLIYFLEEMEDVMDHLKMVGIENLTKIWINSAKRPQCKNPFQMKNEVESVSELSHLKNIKEEHEDDEESEKDFDSHIESSQKSLDNDDTFYKDFCDIVPQTITFGPENVLYHYIQLDFSEGVILSSINLNSCKEPNDILTDIFRRGCLQIHRMLQNTLKFNKMITKENKISRAAILPKEQGISVQLKIGNERINFWIVGRLFGIKELYVCYDSRIPQNMVEIAFRIGLNCVG